jgi:polyhydroxybutyrate depolymerase
MAMKHRTLMVMAAIAAVVAACSSAAALTSQPVTMTLGSNPVRTSIVYKPANLKPGAPLVIVLHGTPATGATMQSLTGFDAVADAHGFVVAYPNSLKAGEYGLDTGWEMGCCDAYSRSTTDFHFLSTLIDELAGTDHIDTSRVYVAGFSIGAAMAYRIACQLPAKIAGIASVGGFEFLSTPCKPARPVSVYEIHGTTDYFGGSCGGSTESDAGCPHGFGHLGYEPSVAQTNAQWRRIDGCSRSVQATRFGSVYRQLWSHCTGSSEVQLDVIVGGRHCWPQANSSCGDYDASDAIWQFLSSARLNPPTHASGNAKH